FDPATPTLVIMSLILHHLADFHVLHLLDVLRQRLAPGSRLLVSAFIADPFPGHVRDRLIDLYPAVPPLVLRTATQTGILLRDVGWPAPAPRACGGLYTAMLHQQPTTAEPRRRHGRGNPGTATTALPPVAEPARRTRGPPKPCGTPGIPHT